LTLHDWVARPDTTFGSADSVMPLAVCHS